MKTDITQEQWKKIKEQGKFKYILFHWIITISLPLGILLPTLRVLIYRNFTFSHLITSIIGSVIFLSILSSIFGLRKWKKCSKMFN